MRMNLRVILSAVGVAALLASPAMAKTVRDVRGPVAVQGYRAIEGGAYTPSAPTTRGFTRDFQDASTQFSAIAPRF